MSLIHTFCHLRHYILHRKGKALNLLQDLYAHSEPVTASCPITDAAVIRSEVTLVNHSTTAWNGHLHITIDHCKPLTSGSERTELREQPWSATTHGLNSPEHPAIQPEQSTFSAAEHITAKQGQQSNRSHRHQRRLKTKMQHPAPGQHDLQWRDCVRIPSGQTSFDMTDHILRSPQLWWPLNMGEQVFLAICVPCNLTNPSADHAPLDILLCHAQDVI